MTLSLFWSRYTLELHERHLRDVDAMYRYVIARENGTGFYLKFRKRNRYRSCAAIITATSRGRAGSGWTICWNG